MRFEDFYTLVSGNLQQMLITANDNPASTSYSTGKKFVIIKVRAHGLGEVLSLIQLSRNGYQIKNRFQVNSGESLGNYFPHPPVFF